MSHAGETLLITGFPGFYARQLCAHMLEHEPEARVVVLRRASDAERSAELLSQLSEGSRARVTELEGDPKATMMRLLDWREGYFELASGTPSGKPLAFGSITHLLLEHAQMRDEARR